MNEFTIITTRYLCQFEKKGFFQEIQKLADPVKPLLITNELENPTRGRNLLVCVLAVGTALSVYIFLGGSGYYTFGNKVSERACTSELPCVHIHSAARNATHSTDR